MIGARFTIWTSRDDPNERDALIPVVEAAGFALDRHGFGYGAGSGHSVTIGASWPEVIETLGATPRIAATTLSRLLGDLWQESESFWGVLDEIELIDFGRIIWLTFRKSDLDLPISEWEQLILAPFKELECEGPEASTVIAHLPHGGWGRVDRAGGAE